MFHVFSFELRLVDSIILSRESLAKSKLFYRSVYIYQQNVGILRTGKQKQRYKLRLR
jgi:hypothetical protein